MYTEIGRCKSGLMAEIRAFSSSLFGSFFYSCFVQCSLHCVFAIRLFLLDLLFPSLLLSPFFLLPSRYRTNDNKWRNTSTKTVPIYSPRRHCHRCCPSLIVLSVPRYAATPFHRWYDKTPERYPDTARKSGQPTNETHLFISLLGFAYSTRFLARNCSTVSSSIPLSLSLSLSSIGMRKTQSAVYVSF